MSNGFSYLASADVTDVGRCRKNNEDSVLRLPEHGVFCVADGMGGAQGGEMASRATVASLRETFVKSPDAPFAVTARSAASLVVRALNRASQWIKARAAERGISGTGSTALVLVFDKVMPSQAMILHAGDSRAYRYRVDKLEQLSADHSVAAAAGLRSEKELPAMFRGVITRAVGLEEAVVLEETPVDVAAGDLFLLCSDGLTKMQSDRQIHKLLRKNRNDDVQALTQKLINEALKAGGADNVSVVLVSVGSGLPQGPTQEIGERTRQLERSPTPPAPSPVAAEKEDQEAETGETGQTGTCETVNTAATAFGPSTAWAEGDFIPKSTRAVNPTATAPLSDEDDLPTQAATRAQEPEQAGSQTSRPIQTRASRSLVWWANILLLVLNVIALAAWFLLFRR